MRIFKYVGRDPQGNIKKGEVEASSKDIAVDLVIKKGILPSRLVSKSSIKSQSKVSALFASKVNPSDMIIFTRQIYSLTKAGIPILSAISGLTDACQSPQLKSALHDVLERMHNGYSLSASMTRHPRIFSSLYISLIQVGENTGQLDRVLLQLSEYIEKELETTNQVKAALRYPTFIVLSLVAAMVVLNIYVIPQFVGMFAKFHAELPWTTQILFFTSSFFVHYWAILFFSLFLITVGLKIWFKSEPGMYQWDKWKLRLPIVGSIIERALLARFSRSFAMILSAGVPLNNGLRLVAGAVDNCYLQEKILRMQTGVESGESFFNTASNAGLFTPLILQMIAVGEETGQIDKLLNESADFYEREVDYELKSMATTIEPILISFVAVMVLILALGIFTPMWDMMSVIKGR